MNTRLIFIFVFIISTISVRSQSTLSLSSEISLITCAPGKDVYSLFGHTALRVNDKESGRDIVFNYGIFDFSSENFIWKFVKGETYYLLGVQSYESFLSSYKYEERSVWEQKLSLNKEKKIKLLNLLLYDYKPENRTYLYNFLYNNCATKVRDHLESTLNIEQYKNPTEEISIREIINSYLKNSKWTALGINLALGKPLDENITPRERLFLPLELMYAFEEKGHEANLVFKGKNMEGSFNLFSPFLAIIILIIALLFLHIRRKTKPLKWAAIFWLVISGTGGLILFFISFLSIHPAANPNINLLLFQPLNLIVLMALLLLKQLNRANTVFFIYYFIVLIILLAYPQAIASDIILLNILAMIIFYPGVLKIFNRNKRYYYKQ